MSTILCAKAGAALMLIAILFGSGYHFGGMASRAALEADHAAMAEAMTKALIAQQKAAETEHARQQKVIDAYDATKDIPDPATVGVAHRLYVAAAGGCQLPQAHPAPSGTPTPPALPGGAGRTEQALAVYIDACAADAEQMSALIELNKTRGLP